MPSRAHVALERLGRRARDLLGERHRLLGAVEHVAGDRALGQHEQLGAGRGGLLEARRGRPRGSAPSRRAPGSICATATRIAGDSTSLTPPMRAIRFYYDVVCPYSYMESHAVEAAEDAGAVEVEWLPFELRPAPRPLLEVRGDHLRVDWTQNVYRARARRSGIEIHLPRYQPRSTLPLAACLWAAEQGRLRDVQARALRGVLLRGRGHRDRRARSRARPSRAGLDPDGGGRGGLLAGALRPDRARSGRRPRRRASSGVPSLLGADGGEHWGMGGARAAPRRRAARPAHR